MVNKSLDSDDSVTLAIEALSFVAADTVLFSRFLRLTGLVLENLREAADEPGFLAGVLDFVIADAATLTDFASHAQVGPDDVVAARRALGRHYAESVS